MKKLFFTLLLSLVLAVPQLAAAEEYTSQADCTSNCGAGSCTYIAKNGVYECTPAVAPGTCSGTNQGNYTCTMAGNNTTPPTDGGCTGSNGGHTLTCSSVPTGYTKLSDATNPSTPTSGGTGAVSGGSTTFVPLASVPGLTDTPTNNLSAFFNNLYKFCIGAAAVLAILEITLGGFKVMSGDSVTAHSAGRDQIVGAILGLVLVLSPFLVFSIINPSILTFGAFSGDLQSLQPSTGSGTGTSGGGAATGVNTASPNSVATSTATTPSATAGAGTGNPTSQPATVPFQGTPYYTYAGWFWVTTTSVQDAQGGHTVAANCWKYTSFGVYASSTYFANPQQECQNDLNAAVSGAGSPAPKIDYSCVLTSSTLTPKETYTPVCPAGQ